MQKVWAAMKDGSAASEHPLAIQDAPPAATTTPPPSAHSQKAEQHRGVLNIDAGGFAIMPDLRELFEEEGMIDDKEEEEEEEEEETEEIDDEKHKENAEEQAHEGMQDVMLGGITQRCSSTALAASEDGWMTDPLVALALATQCLLAAHHAISKNAKGKTKGGKVVKSKPTKSKQTKQTEVDAGKVAQLIAALVRS